MFNISTPSIFSKIVDDEISIDILTVEARQHALGVDGRMFVSATFIEFDLQFVNNDRLIKDAIASVVDMINDSTENATQIFCAESVNLLAVSPMHIGGGRYVAIIDWRGALPYVPSTDREMAVDFGFQRSFSF